MQCLGTISIVCISSFRTIIYGHVKFIDQIIIFVKYCSYFSSSLCLPRFINLYCHWTIICKCTCIYFLWCLGVLGPYVASFFFLCLSIFWPVCLTLSSTRNYNKWKYKHSPPPQKKNPCQFVARYLCPIFLYKEDSMT